MKILIAGSNGMIGSAVTRHLIQQGNQVLCLVRRELGIGEVFWIPDAGKIDKEGIEGFDAVIHLATMPWPLRWTAKAKHNLRTNRLATNRLLAESLAGCEHKPKVLICASGMGIYPSSDDQILTEDSPLGKDFLAKLQCDGEAATESATAAGIRVVNLRIPSVLGGENLKQSMNRMGNGHQWFSWVSRDELAYIIEFVILNEAIRGPINTVSPNPVHNTEFVESLSLVQGQKPGLPMPRFLLRFLLGEMADALILASRRGTPAKLLVAGYQFRFPYLEDALRHELGVNQKVYQTTQVVKKRTV